MLHPTILPAAEHTRPPSRGTEVDIGLHMLLLFISFQQMAYDVTLRMFAERRRVGLGPGQASLITALTSAIVEEFLRCQCPVREPEALRLLLFHALPRAADREPAGT